LAGAAVDFSGAEIEESINSALYDAFYSGQEVTTAHVQQAITQAAEAYGAFLELPVIWA
jgi:hypothetical protein